MAQFGFWVFIVGAGAYAVAAGYTDLRLQRIPNYLTVAAAVGGLACSTLAHFGRLPDYPTDLVHCLLGFAFGFGLFFIPFALGGGGSGDVKLAAALGALLGFYDFLFTLLIALAFAMIAAFVIWTTSFSATANKKAPSKAAGASKPKSKGRAGIAFAVPLALATLFMLCAMCLEKTYPALFDRSNQNVGSPQRPSG